MVKEHLGDIFTAPINVLVHQANCFHTMGSGIARHIREKFPEAYKADCEESKYGDPKKLGIYTKAKVVSKNPNPNLKYIVNMYSQFDMGRDKRYTQYDAVVNGMELLRDNMTKHNLTHLVVGIPWKYGSNIAGGDWNVVEAIIKSVFENSPITVLICKHPDAEYLNKKILGTPSQPK